MPCCAFHAGIGYKQVITANSMNVVYKQSLLGRTKSYNSEGNISQAMVAKIPHAHVFCPGKFSHWKTSDKHLFFFLCDHVAKKSTNKRDNLCQGWSFEMTKNLGRHGIHTVLDLYQDICCVPSCTFDDPLFNDADRTAILLAFWQVEELQFFNVSYFTKPSVFDWEKPCNEEDNLDELFHPKKQRNDYSSLLHVYQPRFHTIPLHIYFHENTARKVQRALREEQPGNL